ncbi:MAG: LytTR family DNA-binding domain-containing protein [Bacteroidota bacterium]
MKQTSLKTLIVDDSAASIRTLKNLIARFCPDLDVIGEAGSVKEALGLLIEHKPDLVFLDIEMPEENGFGLIEKGNKLALDFDVIFTTAFHEYALKAIKFSALDYLVKPIDFEELVAAVQKARKNLLERNASQRYLHLIQNLRQTNLQKLALPTQNGFQFIPIDSISHCQSEGNYIRIYQQDGSEILATRLLKEVEDLLPGETFFRIHRSSLINLDCVKQYHRGEGGTIQMLNGKELSVSRARKEPLLARLKAR